MRRRQNRRVREADTVASSSRGYKRACSRVQLTVPLCQCSLISVDGCVESRRRGCPELHNPITIPGARRIVGARQLRGQSGKRAKRAEPAKGAQSRRRLRSQTLNYCSAATKPQREGAAKKMQCVLRQNNASFGSEGKRRAGGCVGLQRQDSRANQEATPTHRRGVQRLDGTKTVVVEEKPFVPRCFARSVLDVNDFVSR